MKKILSIVLILVLVVTTLFGCTTKEGTEPTGSENDSKGVVGISMPEKELSIWVAQGTKLKDTLESAGYEVMLEYANNEITEQILQIENMLTKGIDYLIITAVDCYTVSDVIKKAKENGVVVISSDRLIMDTADIDYYVGYDSYHLGEMQAGYIIEKMGLEKGEGPFTMEIFSGSLDDSLALLFYQGAIDSLKPYIDKGQLIVKSGQIAHEQTATQSWSSAVAQARMDNLIGGFYSKEKLDIVMCSNDSTAMGAIASLTSMGYGSPDLPFPLIVGQDCELPSINYIREGKQSMSILLDTELFSETVLGLLDTVGEGGEVTPNKLTNNNATDVPTLLYDLLIIDKDNINLLVDRGFYTAEDLGM